MSTTIIHSEEQVDIFREFAFGRSHFVVDACAGTGKTYTCKVGIEKAPEQKKCYVAFNKRNVAEAKEKIKDPRCQVKSLNGLGFGYTLQQRKGVKPDDAVEYDRIRACAAVAYRGRQYVPAQAVKDLVSWAKNTAPFARYEQLLDLAAARNIDVEDYQAKVGWTQQDVAVLAEAAMALAKTPDAQGRISFNDQIWLPVVMGWVRPWFDLLVVDECQDLNTTQLLMIEKAVKPAGRLVLVGDPYQCIYGFRGASPAGFERLKTKLRAKTLSLTTTYRCPQSVVALAQQLVPHYKAAPAAPAGVIRRVAEAGFTAQLEGGDAVLSRVNAPLMPLCLQVLQRGQRAYIEGRDIGKTLADIHTKVAAGAADLKAYTAALDAWAAAKIEKVQGEPDSETYQAAVQTVLDSAETLQALAAADGVTTPAQVAARLVSLFEDSDKDLNPVKPVVFSSIHKAKGLEWRRTYLLAVTFKKAPWSLAKTEEQRILYVGVTRTMHELVWVDPVLAAPAPSAAVAAA